MKQIGVEPQFRAAGTPAEEIHDPAAPQQPNRELPDFGSDNPAGSYNEGASGLLVQRRDHRLVIASSIVDYVGDAGATNAGLLAAAILALEDPELAARLETLRQRQTASVPETPKSHA